jgi:two-component system, NarL family, sensor kinase
MRLPALAGRHPSGRNLATAQFVLSVLTLLLVVGTAGLYALHRIATDEALREATRLTQVVTQSVITPEIDGRLLDGDPGIVARLDELMSAGVVGDTIVRVKLWTPDGRLVYSDEHQLMGLGLKPAREVAVVARTGRPAAQLSELEAEENDFERGLGDLFEVYAPLHATDGTVLVAETYQSTQSLRSATDRLWRALWPLLLAAVVALALAQLPIGWWYGRRSRQQAEERVELLARAQRARQDERSRIASDLHDGVVQDLAGMSFDLAATAEQVDTISRQDVVTALRNGSRVSRSSIAQLRTLLIQLHPGDETELDLTRALPDLAEDLKGRGVAVEVDVERITLDEDLQALVLRAAQEGVRNVARHAAATRATISLRQRNGMATLLIEDDGQGMTPRDLVDQRAAGHVGLTLLATRVRTQQGELTISSEPGRGTRLTVSLPLIRFRPPDDTPH